MSNRLFASVLIANRGEIAVRISQTLRRLGIRAVGVYTPADAFSRHVRVLDEAVALASDDGYLDPAAIVAAAERTGCEAVHPGYGFLAENPALARACEQASGRLAFVGPSARVIALMGDKIAARAAAEAAGVPVLPGRSEHGLSDADLREAARDLGLPLLLKPAAGGGGKGMHVVERADELDAAIALARAEARAAFGDDTLFLERYVELARHIEVQVLADEHANVLHLGERDCSLQRRHQKVIEEAPAPGLSERDRQAMCEQAVELARSCGYVGAGTVEFVVPELMQGWYFLEMNTRLQVEHRVTELVWGVDLVEAQLICAAGEELRVRQRDLRPSGHAVEARLYAEDPMRGFLPTGGKLLAVRLPAGPPSPPGEPVVLVDSGFEAGDVVGTRYDPLIAKIVVWAPHRPGALARLEGELAASSLLGVVTNLELLLELLRRPEVRSANPDTNLVERFASASAERVAQAAAEDEGVEVLVAAAVALELARLGPARAGAGRCGDPWEVQDGWRLGGPCWSATRLRDAHRAERVVSWRGRLDRRGGRCELTGEVRVGSGAGATFAAQACGDPCSEGSQLLLELGGLLTRFDLAVTDRHVWVGRAGAAVMLGYGPTEEAPGEAGGGEATIRSPMPGIVRRVTVTPGASVRRGEPVVVVEAMKMQHLVVAPTEGSVAEVRVGEGERVELDQVLAVVTPHPGGGPGAGLPAGGEDSAGGDGA